MAAGQKVLGVMCDILFKLREDVDMVRGALEVLLAACGQSEDKSNVHQGQQVRV